MPVRKFRTLLEAEDSLWYEPDDPRLWKAIAGVWDFGTRTTGYRFPPGVYKLRSVEEANKLHDEWEKANFESYQRRLKPIK
jgi:hypothetical protein